MYHSNYAIQRIIGGSGSARLGDSIPLTYGDIDDLSLSIGTGVCMFFWISYYSSQYLVYFMKGSLYQPNTYLPEIMR